MERQSTEAEREGANGGLRRVGLGVAGLGRIGLMHAENLAGQVPSAELLRVVDADEARARATGEQLGVAWSTSYEDLLADPNVHGVVIATPTPLHVEMVERAAAAGKHIFCEKPISLDLSSTLAAIDVAREAGSALQIGFHRRFDPDFAAAAERIDAGELGDVYFFRTTLRDKQPPPMEYIKASGGFFVDVTIHDLDAARWLVGEIEEVTAHGAALSDPAFEAADDVDNAVVVLRFANGALGVIDESRAAGYGYGARRRSSDRGRRSGSAITAGSATPGSRRAAPPWTGSRTSPSAFRVRTRSSWRTSRPRSGTREPPESRARTAWLHSSSRRRASARIASNELSGSATRSESDA